MDMVAANLGLFAEGCPRIYDIRVDVCLLATGPRVWPEPMQETIFISFVDADRNEAERLKREFEALGYNVQTDQDIPPGANWKAELERRVREADRVVVLLSRNSQQSDIVRITTASLPVGSRALQPIAIGRVDLATFP